MKGDFYSFPLWRRGGFPPVESVLFYLMKGRDRGRMKDLVRLEGVSKVYGNHAVIPPLDLSIRDGEFLTLLGPSGCGKTTILRMIAGLESPSSGRIVLDGEDITYLPPYKRDVNTVFQNYALFPHMTVEENISFGLRMKGVPSDEAKRRIDRVLSLIRLENLRKRYPSQMSGGQQQRVAIARALVNNPKILLLDEPLGALDYQLRKTLQIELKDLQAELGVTFVFVTHDQEEALTMSDRIVIIDNGVIQQDDVPDVVYHRPINSFVAEFIGESNFFDIQGKCLMLRPEKLNLCAEDDSSGSHPAPHYFGTVDDVIFYGTIDKVFIKLDGTGQEVLAYQYFDDVRRWQIDERVGIWWYKEDEVAVER